MRAPVPEAIQISERWLQNNSPDTGNLLSRSQIFQLIWKAPDHLVEPAALLRCQMSAAAEVPLEDPSLVAQPICKQKS